MLAENDKCTGCSACFNICPKKAITMEPDKGGFLHPTIQNEKCVKCGLCEKVCPLVTPLNKNKDNFAKAYVARHKDNIILSESTSGGAFTGIAAIILKNNGVVFGAALDDDYVVRHTFVFNIEDLKKFRNSKYVQSEIGDSYSKCKDFLIQGKEVLFSGTPCQIAGLISFLGEKYDNLTTIDIVCHSVPSPLIFKKYVELQKSKYPTMDKLVFRDKKNGYSYSTMALYDSNDKCLYRRGSESDLWFRSFLPGLCDRENCYNCQFQSYPRLSDITIWDCFNVESLNKDFDDDKGATSVVVWNTAKKHLIEFNDDILYSEVPIEKYLHKINREIDKKISIDRNKMYDDAIALSPEAFFDKYRKETFKIKVKKFIRELLYKIHLYRFVKKHFG